RIVPVAITSRDRMPVIRKPEITKKTSTRRSRRDTGRSHERPPPQAPHRAQTLDVEPKSRLGAAAPLEPWRGLTVLDCGNVGNVTTFGGDPAAASAMTQARSAR
ncbi:hypothetical protein I553_3846, partial [Mycobacterium xenopi 4042]